jgi:hypothetical protein
MPSFLCGQHQLLDLNCVASWNSSSSRNNSTLSLAVEKYGVLYVHITGGKETEVGLGSWERAKETP